MIDISDVSHEFVSATGEQLHVLDHVSLTIERGEFVSFLGPSGCGKTTLLRIMHGLVIPLGGRVSIAGALVRGHSPTRAMVFQDFNLMPWRTAENNAKLGLELRRLPLEQQRRVARSTLKRVSLGGFEQYMPHQLSGGMKQRVGVARALSIAPETLLLDEPFGALDPLVREVMQLDMLRLFEAEPRTVVLVTHSIDEAIFLSDRIVVFSTRPGHVIDIVDVDLPKPRWEHDDEIKASPRFAAIRRHIWSVLRTEVDAGSRTEGPDPDTSPNAPLIGADIGG